MRHLQKIGKPFSVAFLYIFGFTKGIGRWCVDLFFIKDTLGFSLATGLFSFLCGTFLTIELLFKYGLDFNNPVMLAFFWGVFASFAGASQLYAVSIQHLKLRQVAAIIQLLMYLFFLTLTILSGGVLLLVAIILTQIILLLVSSVRLTQELQKNKTGVN